MSQEIQVRNCIRKNRGPVITIRPDATVLKAIEKLVENNIGALPVYGTNGVLLGIVSERDILKECAKNNRAIEKTKVQDVMTRDVVICGLEDDLSYVTSVMTQRGIRHLPVLDKEGLIGIISMRDVVDVQLEESETTVRFLNDYISSTFSV